MHAIRLAALAALVATIPMDAAAIPAFARRYGVSCQLCHAPAPKLTAFGKQFAGNGFRFAAVEAPRDTMDTGDPLLELARSLPLALRGDAYVRAYTEGTSTDFQTPYGFKILSGGTLGPKLSYYVYFFLFERGEIGGVEDAFLYVNDIGNVPVDLAVGQFQVSDPMFKRELRLMIDDYVVYRARVGQQTTDLTYDRGMMAAVDAAGFTLTAEAINGNGRGPADESRRLDADGFKTLFGHLTRDLGPNLRLGALGYYGRADGVSAAGVDTLTNTTWMFGGDATISLGPVEINAQYLHREDDAPTFTAGEPIATLDGGFAEVIVQPPASRWYGVGLYNGMKANLPMLDPRMGGVAGVDRYHTVTGGLGYLIRRNVRTYGEVTWDIEAKEAAFGLGVTAAF
jgi:thiol-disulfide isomerase/thioredoxin